VGRCPESAVTNPGLVIKDEVANYGDDPTTVTLKVTYTDSTTDTTTWEHAWGFEFGASLASEINFFVEKETLTLSATASYNGKYGTSSAETHSVVYDRSQTYTCPARHRCFMLLIGRKMDNAAIPYTAHVQRSMENGQFKDMYESGFWRGLKLYDTFVKICTQNVDTGEDNCPEPPERIYPMLI